MTRPDPAPGDGLLSAQHPTIKHLRRLLGRRRSRRDHGQYVIEGPGLVIEAIGAGVDVEVVLVEGDEGAAAEAAAAASAAGVPVRRLAPGVLARAASTVTPQPAVAVARGRPLDLGELLGAWSAPAEPSTSVLVLAGVADPGNAGTLVRVAEATGAAAAVFTAGSVDPSSPKVVRAAAGSSFRVPLVEGPDALATVLALREVGLRTLGAVARGGLAHTRADLTGSVAFVLGSESHGLAADVVEALDEVVAIPMAGQVESLNVGVAGALLCFERVRQLGA